MNLKNCRHLIQVFLSFKDFSAGKRTTPTIADNSFSPSIKWYKKFKFWFDIQRKLLKATNASFAPTNTIYFFVLYELDAWSQDLNSDFKKSLSWRC